MTNKDRYCVWSFALDEWGHRKWLSGCGGESPIYFFPINDVPFKYCPDCGYHIATEEELQARAEQDALMGESEAELAAKAEAEAQFYADQDGGRE